MDKGIQANIWSANHKSKRKRGESEKKDRDEIWGFGELDKYIELKKKKLREQFHADDSRSLLYENEEAKDLSRLFAGVTIHVNGYTEPSHQELRLLMLSHGGMFENYYSSARVTHIICSNLPDGKYINFKNNKSIPPVVRPEWVLDSIAARKLLPVDNFILQRLALAHPDQKQLPAPGKGQALLPSDRSSAESDAESEPEALQQRAELSCPTGHEPTEPPCHPVLSDSSDGLFSEDHDNYKQAKTLKFADLETSNGQKSSELPVEIGDKVLEPEAGACGPLPHRTDVTARPHSALESGNSRAAGLHSTKDDPNFIQNYYKNSRLHFIGTWRNRQAAQPAHSRPARPKPAASGAAERAVIHVDMDCFFVAVAVRGRADLAGKPVAVSHSDSGRGSSEISSANYEARKFGVRAGMFMKQAKGMCPDLTVLPYDFEGYEKVAEQVVSILESYSDSVQVLSCDEAFLDVSGLGDASDMAACIRRDIAQATQCTASAGIGPNLLLARLATRQAKPNGQFRVAQAEAEGFLSRMPVSCLHGVGHALSEKLLSRGVETCADLRKVAQDRLRREFGDRTGDMLYMYCRGIDTRPVSPNSGADRKSIGAEVNWGVRFSTHADADAFLAQLASEVSGRLSSLNFLGRTVTLKLKRRRKGAPVEPAKFMGCGLCDSYSRSVTLKQATLDPKLLLQAAKQLYAVFQVPPAEVRGLGLQLTRLEPSGSTPGGAVLLEDMLARKGAADAQAEAGLNVGAPKPAMVEGTMAEVQDADSASLSQSLPVEESSRKLEAMALPSASQLDPGVMQCLPLSIRREVEQAVMVRNNKKPGQRGRSSRGTRAGPQADQKRDRNQRTLWQLGVQAGGDSSRSASRSATVTRSQAAAGEELAEVNSCPAARHALLSMTQMDPAVFAGLPEDIQREIAENVPEHRGTSSSQLAQAEVDIAAVDKCPTAGHGGRLLSSPFVCLAEEERRDDDLWDGDPPLWVRILKDASSKEVLGMEENSALRFLAEKLSVISPKRFSELLSELALSSDGRIEQAESGSLVAVVKGYIRRIVGMDLEETQATARSVIRLRKNFGMAWNEVECEVVQFVQSLVQEVYGCVLQL